MYFISESYDHILFNEMLGRFVFVLSYVWIGGGCWTAAASSSSRYLKSKLLISNLIFLFFLGDKFLISSATIMPNKSSLLGIDCNDLLMSSIISNSLLVFCGACLTYSLHLFALQCLCHRVSNDWLVATFENKLFLEQSLKLPSASVVPSSFGLISATFAFAFANSRNHIFWVSSLPVSPHDLLNRILLLFCTLLSFYWTSSSNYQIVVSLHLD